MVDPLVLLLIHAVLTGLAVFVSIVRRDEKPLLITLAVSYFGFYRYAALTFGWTEWVDVSRLFGVAPIEGHHISMALGFMTLGEAALVAGYVAIARKPADVIPFSVAETRIARHIVQLALIVAWILLLVSLVARMAIGSATDSGAFLTLGYGYLTHLTFLKIGGALVLWQVYLAGGVKSGASRFFFFAFWPALVLDSLQPGKRFEFLGWMVGVLLLWSYGNTGKTYFQGVATGLIGVLVLVGVAGALRGDLAEGELGNAAYDRIVSARDANMLEGFALDLQLYPAIVPFRFGGGHLEILYRPIPRAIWPDKPYGSALAGTNYDFERLGATGISPSLFGSFYEEGGGFAIVIFSVLYGIGIATLSNWAGARGRLVGGLISASMAAALVPLLRGGDLPGIVAWLGFSFLPVAVFVLYAKRRLSTTSNPLEPTY